MSSAASSCRQVQPPSSRVNLLDLGAAALEDFVVSQLGQPAYRARQITQWLHQHAVTDIDQMTNLSLPMREALKEQAEIRLPEVSFESFSKDGTCKWLFRLWDGNNIETVFIPDKGRGTLCVSSQVGCALNCDFCSTGKQGFNRHLALSEIIGQLWLAKSRLYKKTGEARAITNVVFMGMGEPLLNYEPVVEAMRLMLSDYAYGLSKYRVTLSTSGVVPAMERLKKDVPVAFAVSLHAANNKLRTALVPLNKKYPLEVLIPACRAYFEGTKREILFEYVMLDGVNDSIEQAKELIELIRGIRCKVNLIPFNPFPRTQFRTSTAEQILRFQGCLRKAGIGAWIRRSRGDDIDAACGQLVGEFDDRTRRREDFYSE